MFVRLSHQISRQSIVFATAVAIPMCLAPAEARLVEESSMVGQPIRQQSTAYVLLACGGGGSDSERRPKRPHRHAPTSVDPAAPVEVKP